MASRFPTPFSSRRGLRGGDPFLDLHREVNRLFDDSLRSLGGGEPLTAPSVDVHETEDGLEVTAELPGVDQQDIDLRLEGDLLTIRGEKRKEHKDEQARLVERSYGSFVRSLQLPFTPDAERVTAHCDRGLLRIRLPKCQEQDRSRRIAIGTGQTVGAEAGAASEGGRSAIGRNWETEGVAGQGRARQQDELDREQAETGQGAPA